MSGQDGVRTSQYELKKKKKRQRKRINVCIQQIRNYQTFFQVMGTLQQVKQSVPPILELAVQ